MNLMVTFGKFLPGDGHQGVTRVISLAICRIRTQVTLLGQSLLRLKHRRTLKTLYTTLYVTCDKYCLRHRQDTDTGINKVID